MIRTFLTILATLAVGCPGWAELKYETPHPFVVSKNSEAKCGMIEDAQALLTDASAFMKQYWDVEKPTEEQMQEVAKKMQELEEKVFYLRWCYNRRGDWTGARVVHEVINDMGALQRKLWWSRSFPFPNGEIRIEF